MRRLLLYTILNASPFLYLPSILPHPYLFFLTVLLWNILARFNLPLSFWVPHPVHLLHNKRSNNNNLAIEQRMGEGLMRSLSCKKKSDLRLEMWQWQARYSRLKFVSVAITKLEDLCTGIPKFIPLGYHGEQYQKYTVLIPTW
jgi:hypothetical protein